VQKYDVIAVGDAKLDEFLTIHNGEGRVHLNAKTRELSFHHGDKIYVDRCDLALGGNAANLSVGLSRLGFKVAFFAEIGDDELSIKIINSLAKEHVERSFIRHTKNFSTSISVALNYKNDRVLFAQHTRRDHEFDFEGVDADLIYLTSMGEEWQKPYRKLLKYALKKRIPIAFNPGSVQLSEGGDTVRQILRHTFLLFVNKEEAEILLYGKESSKDTPEYREVLLNELQRIGVRMIVLTDGAKGSWAMDEFGRIHMQGLVKGKVVERTGAGDGYTSGFLGAMLSGRCVPDAMVWGATNATAVVGAIGAQAGLLTREEMKEKIK
jgi:ribokinase